MYASSCSLTTGPETWGLGLTLRPYVRYSDGHICATPGLDFLSEDYVLLNQLENKTMIWRKVQAIQWLGWPACDCGLVILPCGRVVVKPDISYKPTNFPSQICIFLFYALIPLFFHLWQKKMLKRWKRWSCPESGAPITAGWSKYTTNIHTKGQHDYVNKALIFKIRYPIVVLHTFTMAKLRPTNLI